MDIKEDIQKILEISVNAPSGSNSQPWEFRVKSNQVDIVALPEKDHPILNYHYRGTWIAHGALLENILIASSALGYKLNFKIFPDKSEPNLTARIFLEKASPKKEPLYSVISKRTTNRKPYKAMSLTAEQKGELLKSLNEVGGGAELRFIEDREKINIVGQAGSINEVVTLENKLLHKLFFNEIVWSEKEELEKGKGLYFKTMELKPPKQKALKLFRHWWLMNIFNKLGIARAIAKDNSKTYSTGSAMIAIIVDDRDEDFVTAGRLMERIWLKATLMGLSLHLITGILFFWQRIKAGLIEEFSSDSIKLVGDAYNKTADAFGVTNKIVSLVLRIGEGGEPSARSIKNPPQIEYI